MSNSAADYCEEWRGIFTSEGDKGNGYVPSLKTIANALVARCLALRNYKKASFPREIVFHHSPFDIPLGRPTGKPYANLKKIAKYFKLAESEESFRDVLDRIIKFDCEQQPEEEKKIRIGIKHYIVWHTFKADTNTDRVAMDVPLEIWRRFESSPAASEKDVLKGMAAHLQKWCEGKSGLKRILAAAADEIRANHEREWENSEVKFAVMNVGPKVRAVLKDSIKTDFEAPLIAVLKHESGNPAREEAPAKAKTPRPRAK